MKFQLPSLKLIGQLLLVLLIAVAVGTGLLTLAYTIPVDKIDANAADSAYIFEREGLYPPISEDYVSLLDTFTDAMMLKEAAYRGDESAFRKAMLCPRNRTTACTSDSPVEEFILYYSFPDSAKITETYPRYWHGYLIFLKPLLTFLNYGQIRNLNLYIQLALGIFILILLIIKKNWQLIPAFILTILMLRIEVTAYSMQHAAIYCVFSIACILILLLGDSLRNTTAYSIFYLLLGAATSYFDYLTYPMVAFGIPAVLFVFMNRDNKYSDLRIVLNVLICWFIGYIGMWAAKWLMATIFTNENVITNAIATIKIRSGTTMDDNSVVSYGSTLLQTFLIFFITPYLPAYLAVLIIEIILFIFLHKKHALKESLSIVFVGLTPFVWYLVTINHSYTHKLLFTYKEWAITTFALLSLFANIKFKSKNKQPYAI